jgi:hypothetical protein
VYQHGTTRELRTYERAYSSTTVRTRVRTVVNVYEHDGLVSRQRWLLAVVRRALLHHSSAARQQCQQIAHGCLDAIHMVVCRQAAHTVDQLQHLHQDRVVRLHNSSSASSSSPCTGRRRWRPWPRRASRRRRSTTTAGQAETQAPPTTHHCMHRGLGSACGGRVFVYLFIYVCCRRCSNHQAPPGASRRTASSTSNLTSTHFIPESQPLSHLELSGDAAFQTPRSGGRWPR